MSATPDAVLRLVIAAGFDAELIDDEVRIDFHGDEETDGDFQRHCFVKIISLTDTYALLTFSTDYPFFARGAAAVETMRLGAHECTQWIPIGNFQVDDDGSVHLRYSIPVADANLEAASTSAMTDTLSLLDFSQLHFGDYLEALCADRVDIEHFASLVAQGEEFAAEHGLV